MLALNKKAAILISLILALVFTLGIVWTTNKELQRATETVNVAQTTRFIPAGDAIKENDIKMVPVQKEMAGNLVADKQTIIGKSPVVSLLEGQYVYKNSLDKGAGRKPGYVEVFIPTDITSSAMAVAGEKVDIHLVDKNNRESQSAQILYKGATILHSKDQQGNEIVPGSNSELSDVRSPKGHVPVAVGVEVPENIAEKLVQYASNDAVYLVKSGDVE